ncbi:MAG: lipopolysaccharide biosynthesis protein [Acidobacteriota bacterium]|nr:lipopolysaccharide biosynthesis protein [Acidobacteriota bacterium]
MTSPADVAQKTVRAALWAFVAATGKRVFTLVGLILLARILAPHDFGLLGFSMLYITFAEMIGDFGSSMALVYWPDRREDAAQTTFIINVIAGVFWCVVSLLLAPYIANFFHAPHGIAIVRALSPALLIKFLGNTHDALAQKDLRFRARTIPELSLSIGKASIALVFAGFGFGAWSLVWGQLGALAIWTILLWITVPWRPEWRIPHGLFKPMLRYGRSIVTVNVLAAVMFDADLVVVGRFLGVTALGLYQMAGRVPEATVMVMLWVVSKVLFPAFSNLHAAGEDLREAYLIAVRSISSLTLPASLGLFFLAKPIMLVFFGMKWVGAAPILKLLSLYIGIRSVDHHAGDVLKATGRADMLALLNLVKTVLIVPAVILGAMRSAVAVAGALTLVYAFATVITLMTAARVIRVPVTSILAAFAPSVKAATAMSVFLLAWVHWSQTFPAIVQLVVGVAVGAMVSLATLRFVDPQMFLWARATIFGRPTEEVLHIAAP